MVDPLHEIGVEGTMTDAIRRYEEAGFQGQFSSRPEAMVKCHTCHEEEPADQVPMKALRRFEGSSDPADEVAVAALECPACGTWGTLVLSYGMGGSMEDLDVLKRLMDDRAHSTIRPGL